MVDGCITNDGDTFLYGARTIIKDFAVSAKVHNMQHTQSNYEVIVFAQL